MRIRLRRVRADLPDPALDPVRVNVAGEAANLARDERAVRATSSTVLGMVLFVASEAMFFAAFFGAYFSVYTSHSTWPPASITPPDLALPTVVIVVLAGSAAAVQVALRSAARRADRTVRVALLAAFAGGLVWLALAVAGYAGLTFGAGSGEFGGLFYIVTIIGAAHVAAGIVLLAIVLQQTLSGQAAVTAYEPVRVFAIYWDFVVLLATAIYVVFYVLVNTG
jgi:cytochrome c oxidase subunit III